MTEYSVLLADDDPFFLEILAGELADAGFLVTTAGTFTEALKASDTQVFSAAVLDIMMPVSNVDPVTARNGLRAGQALARDLRTKFPHLKIVGMSIARNELLQKWFFAQESMAFLQKTSDTGSELIELLRNMLLNRKRSLRIFIVHGRDTRVLLELKNFLQNTLKLGEPIILAEQPSRGRTLLEKFEEYSSLIDVAFVLFTPDDIGGLAEEAGMKSRARQNVIFELGYFAGVLGRKTGKIIVLVKDGIELPSDIHGLVYINITNGVAAAGEDIRRELKDFLT
jgi:predicted nucleotide-binding protein